MGAVQGTLQIGVLTLICVALLVALIVVWQDDQQWVKRNRH